MRYLRVKLSGGLRVTFKLRIRLPRSYSEPECQSCLFCSPANSLVHSLGLKPKVVSLMRFLPYIEKPLSSRSPEANTTAPAIYSQDNKSNTSSWYGSGISFTQGPLLIEK